MAAKTISQKKFAKLVSSTGVLSQPPGALSRMSNLLFTQRGSLQIADGSKNIDVFRGAVNPPVIEWVSAYSNIGYGQYPYYTILSRFANTALTNVFNVGATVSGAATNPAGTYTFGVVAIGSAGGNDHSSLIFNTSYITITPGASFASVTVTWTPITGAYGYQIWMAKQGIGFPWSLGGALLGTVVGTSTATFTFIGLLVSATNAPPLANTTEYLVLSVGSVSIAGGGLEVFYINVLNAVFAGISPPPAQLAPGDPSFYPNNLAPDSSPYGGILGSACNIPTAIQFAGREIIILGNGLPPMSFLPSDLGTVAPVPLANTFTAAYPAWQASVAWLTGSLVTDGAGNYFTATQGGVSQTPGPPAWNISKGSPTVDGTVIWTSNGPIVGSIAPVGAAHAVSYAGSLWLANTSPTDTASGIDGPSCLKMSDSNNPNSWNPVNTAFISRNDGTQITGLQPFTIAALGISPTGSLCVFKEFTTYQVIGVFGSASFDIQPAQTNLGCIAARSIQFLPGFGVVRFTHLGFAVFDGINDRLISEDIRPYLFGGVDVEADLIPVESTFCYLSQSAQTITPPMYLCAMPLVGQLGQLTRVFCYDLVMKSWAVIDLPWAISSLGTMSIGEGSPLVLAGRNNGTVQRMQIGDLTWDAGAGDQSTVQWSFRSPDLFGEGSTQRLFYQQATIRGYGSPAMVSSILASLWLDGQNLGPLAGDIVPQGGSNLFEIRFSIFRNGERAHLDISGNNGGAAGVIDSIDWAVSPKSALARRIIS